MSILPALLKSGGSSILPKVVENEAIGDTTNLAINMATDLATKVGTKMTTKAGANSTLSRLVPSVRTNWNSNGDIEGMLNGKFLGTNEYYFPSTFTEGALGRATYGSDQPIDQKKVAGLVRAIKNNEDIAPIAGFKNDDGLIDIFDGHHRLAAYQKAGKIPRVKLFTRETKEQAYNYADEWAKNVAKDIQQYLPAKSKTGLDGYRKGMVGGSAPKLDQDTLDLIETLRSVGAEVDDYGNVTVYHRTTPENADKIYSSGKMFGKEANGELYFSTNRDFQPGYGEGVVKLSIPANELSLDDLFDSNADLKLITGKANTLADIKKYLRR